MSLISKKEGETNTGKEKQVGITDTANFNFQNFMPKNFKTQMK